MLRLGLTSAVWLRRTPLSGQLLQCWQEIGDSKYYLFHPHSQLGRFIVSPILCDQHTSPLQLNLGFQHDTRIVFLQESSSAYKGRSLQIPRIVYHHFPPANRSIFAPGTTEQMGEKVTFIYKRNQVIHSSYHVHFGNRSNGLIPQKKSSQKKPDSVTNSYRKAKCFACWVIVALENPRRWSICCVPWSTLKGDSWVRPGFGCHIPGITISLPLITH